MSKRIDEIVIHNFKKHKEYKGDIKGRHFIISGVNGAGKTSIFDAIKRLLGQKVDKDDKVKQPVHLGEKNGKIQLFLTSDGQRYCVEETYTASNGRGRLKFYRMDGNLRDELNPPLERLQMAVGTPIDFTPLMDMAGVDQIAFFKEHLSVDLVSYNHNYEAVYEDRAVLNASIKSLQAKLNAPELRVFQADKDTYTTHKDAAKLLAGKVDLNPIYKRINDLNEHNSNVDRGLATLKEIDDEIARLQEKRAKVSYWLENNMKLPMHPLQEELELAQQRNAAIDAEVAEVSEWNAQVEKVKNYKATEGELAAKQAQALRLTNQLKQLEAELYSGISALPLGEIVEGMTLEYQIGEDERGRMKVEKAGIFLEGLPFHRSQHSYGKCLKALIKLAGYFNAGKLNFISIGDWNLLDKSSQQEVFDLVKNNPDLGIQLGIEKVDDNQEVITEIVQL